MFLIFDRFSWGEKVRNNLLFNNNLCAAVLIFFTIGGLACSSNSGNTASMPAIVTEDVRNPLPDLDAAASAGKPLYASNCALCHGNDGQADTSAADSLPAKPTDLTGGEVASSGDGKIFLVIKNGKMIGGKMTMAPARNLTDEQIWQIVAYVRALGIK